MVEWEDRFEDERAIRILKQIELDKRFNTREIIRELAENGASKREDVQTTDLLIRRLRLLRSTVEKLKQEIYTRKELHEKLQYGIRYQMHKAQGSLENLQGGLGYNTGVDVKRNFLERQLDDLRKESRTQAIQCWQQLIALRKELRNALKEYLSIRQIVYEMKKGDESGDR